MENLQQDASRMIAHLDLDTFFVSVERRKDNRLSHKPLIVGGGTRGVVASCSYEARSFGIHSGMPMRIARRLCPFAIVISGDYEAYEEASTAITEIIAERAPSYEKASIDEFFLDLTGMDRFCGGAQWALDLRSYILKEVGLPLSMGLSVNKLVSKVATTVAKPNNTREVSSQEILPFLAPMAVRKIPLIGPKMSQNLSYMGVHTVALLREIPEYLLTRAFGKHGEMLYQRARGQDNSPVIPHQGQQSMSTERTFAEDTMDMDFLRSKLTSMVEQLGFQLRQKQQLTGCVSVKLRYANFDTVSKQARIAYTASDSDILPKVLHLFERLYVRRVRLRLIGVRFTHLASGGIQLSLFDPYPRQLGIYQTLDAVKDKHGKGIIKRGSGWEIR